jgi:dihydrolipoamide dehydrogenase
MTMSIIEITIPDIGDSKDVNVAEIYIKIGDNIKVDDNVIMLETDKASMDVPATAAGKVTAILVKVGDKVNQGDKILQVQVAQSTAAPIATKVAEQVNSNNNENKVAPVGNATSCDVVVIGAGPGGYTAAFRAADLGKKVILVEKYSTLGGVCLNVGCIPSKALLHVAKVLNEAQEMQAHGVDFGKPKINLAKIKDFKQGIINKLTKGLDSLAKQRKVEVLVGEAKFLSANTLKISTAAGDKTISFAQAIIAAGSHSFKIPGLPEDDRNSAKYVNYWWWYYWS